MSVFDNPIAGITGSPDVLSAHRGSVLLIVNVASRCALSTQYAGLQRLADDHGPDGLVVVGVPCNQFAEQEPGSPGEIVQFCSSTYGVTFPLTGKADVNGPERHPLFATLTTVADAGGYTGDVRWNFEKFLVARSGEPVARFGPQVDPEDSAVLTALRGQL